MDSVFKIAVLAIVVTFATLFYLEYAKSNRYIVIPNGDAAGSLYDTKTDVIIRGYNVHKVER